jgi:hypothetical protein
MRLVTGDSIYLLDDKFEVQNYCDMPWLKIHPNSLRRTRKKRSIATCKCS